MKKNIFLFLTILITTNYFANSQNEEFANTYVYTFNEYFYPWGTEYLNTNSYAYNPYNQFSLFYPYDRESCLPVNTDSDPYNDSRFNIVNYDFPIVDGWTPDLYCNKGIETGPNINNSGNVRISIKGIDDNAGGIPNDGSDDRSRVEMKYYPKHWNGNNYTNDVLNQIYYYRWNFYIPDNDDFQDEVTGNSFHIITQFHQPNRRLVFDPISGIKQTDTPISVYENENDQPPIFITYSHKENATDNKRDIGFLYGYRNSDIPTGGSLDRSSNFKLENGINKGEWNEIILEIKWSPDDNVGYMKTWVNGVSVINNEGTLSGETNNPNHPYIGNDTELKKIRGANMVLNNLDVPLSNIMQIGHYRKYLDTKASLYFDDFIITQNRDLAFSGFKTNLKPEFCDNVLSNISPVIDAIPLPNISKYKFRFEEVGNEINFIEVERITNSYNVFDNENFFIPNKEYRVKVFVKVIGENSYRNYDSDTNCKIRIDKFTKLKDDFCGGILPIRDFHIECYPVANASNYKFRFESTTTSETLWKDSPTPNVDLRFDDRFKPHMKYDVKVRAQNNMFDFDYSTICDIRIPRFTEIIDNTSCNETLSVGDYLYCYRISGATNYKFRFKNSLNQLKWIDSNFPQIQIPNIFYFGTGGNYEVDVRINGHDYSNVCNFNIEKAIINNNLKKLNQQNLLNIYPNPFSQYIILPYFVKNTIVKIYSSTGDLVYNKKIINVDRKINLEYLPNGLYYINILSKDGITKNIIVKK